MPSTTVQALPPPPPKWVLDLNNIPATKAKPAAIPDPPGYAAAVAVVSSKGQSRVAQGKQQPQAAPARIAPSTEELDTLKMKKAWELAIAPAKQLPMSAIGMYMTGNSLQIFSIFMLYQLFKNPIQAVLNTNVQFSRLESDGTKAKMLLVKLVFVLTNCLSIAMGIYKIDAMGLLPTTRSDWLAWEPQRVPMERAYPAFDM